jgi:hypothetical protein
MPNHQSFPPVRPGRNPATPSGRFARSLWCPLVDILSLCIDNSPDQIRQPDDPGNEAMSRLADAAGTSSTSGGWEGGGL